MEFTMYDMSVFGRCLDAAGVEGFFGEGYSHYKIPFRKPNFEGSTFVSKTATLEAREGNVKKGIMECFFPSWARIKFFSKHTLNAMGLPNRSIKALIGTNQWQQRTKPFLISIMAVGDTLRKRLDELSRITDIIGERKYGFSALWVGLQVNRSCPNTGHRIKLNEIIKESDLGLEILSALGWPLQEKFAVDTAPPEAVKELQYNPHCSGICVSNTVKYNFKGLGKKIFGKDISPLAHLNGGGISGPELLPLVCDYIKEIRDLGFEKNINGGGGIFCPEDVKKYRDAGADSIFIGTVATHRPRQVSKIIQYANNLNWVPTVAQ